MKEIYRAFKEEILSGDVHHFLCKVELEKEFSEEYKVNMHAGSKLKDWGELNGFDELSLKKLAFLKVMRELQGIPVFKVLSQTELNPTKYRLRTRLNILRLHGPKGIFGGLQWILVRFRIYLSLICF